MGPPAIFSQPVAGTLKWELAGLFAGASASFDVTVKVEPTITPNYADSNPIAGHLWTWGATTVPPASPDGTFWSNTTTWPTQASTALNNKIYVIATTKDTNYSNNGYYQPTNINPGGGLAPSLSLTKGASPATYSAVGQTITYSYVLKNTGTVPLTSPFTVSDDKATVTVTPPADGTLSPEETTTGTATYTITQADIDAGSVTNTATAHAKYGTTTVDSNQATATVTADKKPALTLEKSANPTTYDAPGDVITYSYKVTNSGNTTFFKDAVVKFVDNKTTVEDFTLTADLAPGASITQTATHTMNQADIDAGSVTNTAKANIGTVYSNEAQATVTADKKPALTLEKSANPTTYDAPGDVITYSYKVTNSGNTTFFKDAVVKFVDNKTTVEDFTLTADLAPGASITQTATHTMNQADIDAGSVTNTAKANIGTVYSNEAQATVTADKKPALTLEKSANPTTYDAPGDVITYSYKVTNSGNTTFFKDAVVKFVDNKTTVEDFTLTADLAPGASITQTATHTMNQADIDAGSVTNTAKANIGTVYSNEAQATVTADKKPALTLEKSANPTTYDAPGDVITYSYKVTNSGNTTFFKDAVVKFVDNKTTVEDFTLTADLAPGASITQTATHTMNQADIDAGSVTNTAKANIGTVYSNEAQATVTADKKPALTLEKSANPTTYDAPGDVITYSYKVTNSGNTTFFKDAVVKFVDNKTTVEDFTLTADLAPGASITQTATHTMNQADIDAGSVTNTAKANIGTVYSNEAQATVTADKKPALTLEKSANPTTYDAPGDVITYSYKVTNSGNTTFFKDAVVKFVDNKTTVEDFTLTADLAPGASITQTATHTMNQADIDAGSVTNTAKANIGTVYSNEAQATVTADKKPALTLEKSANPTTYDAPGDVITYSYKVTNSGNTTFFKDAVVKFVDNKTTVEDFTLTADLAPGASITQTATHTMNQADIDAGSVTNTAKANIGTVYSNEAQATVTADKKPALTLEKSANPTTYDAPGDVITYSYKVTNSGNTTFFKDAVVKFVDNKTTVEDFTLTADLAPGASITQTATHTMNQADIDAGSVTNTAKANIGTVYSNEAQATVTADKKPALTLEKSANPTTYDAPGDVITYSYKVTNSGNTTFFKDAVVKFVDNKTTVEDFTLTADLAPGASITQTATHTMNQADIDAGSVTNTAKANIGTVYSNEAQATVTADKKPALTLEKSANPTTYDAPGDVITYSYKVTNSGNTTFFKDAVVKFVDNKTTVEDFTLTADLAPGASITQTATHTMNQADIDAGSVTNTAKANIGTVYSNEAQATVTADKKPALTLEKSANPTTYDAPGDVITYSYKVTNSGNTTFFKDAVVKFVDNKTTVEDFTLTADLAPGASITQTATHTMNQADIDAGSVTNTAKANIGTVYSNEAQATVTADKKPALTLEKSANPTTYDAPGDVITYSYKVTNSGNTTFFKDAVVKFVDNKTTVDGLHAHRRSRRRARPSPRPPPTR